MEEGPLVSVRFRGLLRTCFAWANGLSWDEPDAHPGRPSDWFGSCGDGRTGKRETVV